ncbi:MAG: hypothetical protein PHT19_05340 [Methylococcus sp.]|nr:hypothetical protein [Methylococcus sp.]
MKLALQIALGVFLGTLSSQLAFDAWRSHLEREARAAAEKSEAEKERTRQELSERVRTLLMRGHQENLTEPRQPPRFIPDDAETQTPHDN